MAPQIKEIVGEMAMSVPGLIQGPQGVPHRSDLVRSSGEFISAHADHVSIDMDKIKELAKLLSEKIMLGDMGLDRWKKHELHPKIADQKAVDWIFFVDTLNFSFWSEDESPDKFCVEYNGKNWTGYWALCAAVNRALDENIPITDPNYYGKITDEQLAHAFRSSSKGVMPMLQERKQNLHDAADVLIKKYGGTFAACISEASCCSKRLLDIIVNDFPSYRDESTLNGRTVYFYKRAQILVADIWACFEAKGVGSFSDIDRLTIFPDYRVPQVLNYFKTMVYSESLEKKLQNNYLFHYGEKEELEIRGCSVWVVELVRNEISVIVGKDSAEPVNSIVLDHYLWDYRQMQIESMRDVPFHKVRCIFY